MGDQFQRVMWPSRGKAAAIAGDGQYFLDGGPTDIVGFRDEDISQGEDQKTIIKTCMFMFRF